MTPNTTNIDNSPLNKGGRVMCITPRGRGGYGKIRCRINQVIQAGGTVAPTFLIAYNETPRSTESRLPPD